MSKYANKLSAIADKKLKLLAEEKKLIEKRKLEIANLAERCDLLHVSNEIIAGLFVDAQNIIKTKGQQIKMWENAGARFLKPAKPDTATVAATE